MHQLSQLALFSAILQFTLLCCKDLALMGSFFYITGTAWSYLLLLYVYVQLSRVAVVGLLFPFLRYFGYGFEWKEATILIWSGLRGAVALALSLSVKAS